MIFNREYLMILMIVFLTGCGAGFSDQSVDLPGDFQFVSESMNDKVIVPREMFKNDLFIPCSVQEYVWDSNFILAKQKATKECFIRNVHIQQVGETYYWLVLTEKRQVIGPLTLVEYKKIRKLYGISDDLSLKMP